MSEGESPPLTPEMLARIEEFEAPIKALLEKKWVVGANDRGMGHYSYAVITEDEEMVVKVDYQIVAEHIVNAHNTAMDS